MLQVWGRKTSSNVQAVMWCIDELGLPVTRYDVGHKYGGNDTPAFRAMNPNGLVPVLQDGDGDPIFESGAVLRYLSARYATAPFWPPDPAARAAVDKWAEWAKLNFAMGFTQPIFWRLVRTPAKERDEAAVAQAAVALDRHAAMVDAELSRRAFLAGDAFTLADIQFGHCLFRYYDVAITRSDLPNLRRYYDALMRRPAYAEHVMVNYDELRVA